MHFSTCIVYTIVCTNQDTFVSMYLLLYVDRPTYPIVCRLLFYDLNRVPKAVYKYHYK